MLPMTPDLKTPDLKAIERRWPPAIEWEEQRTSNSLFRCKVQKINGIFLAL
jgi:hypothetical protein